LEAAVLALLVVVVLLAVVLAAVLWFGTALLQGYLYTEPADRLPWLALLAAAVMVSFYGVWVTLDIWEGSATQGGPVDIPYGVLWDFSPTVSLIADPIPEFESKRRRRPFPDTFKIDKSIPGRIQYKKVDSDEVWDADGVEYIKFSANGRDYMFVYDRELSDDYRTFVDENTGLVMREFEIGRLNYTSYPRLVTYLILTAMHLVLWMVCLWLVLRFQFWHAVWLGGIVWLLANVMVVPMLATEAADILANLASRTA